MAEAKEPAARTVRFLNFRYTGHDPVFDAPLPPGHYRNPILAGSFPDPSLCRVGDDHYLVCSSFTYFPGLPIFHSRDLVNWRLINHAVTEAQGLNFDGLGISRGLFAPALSHHRGRFYLVCTMVDGGGNFLLTTDDPTGPWSTPQWLGFEGIDPSLFIDEDGSAWILNNGAPEGPPRYSGHRAIWQQAFDIRSQTLTGPRRVLVEGGADPRTQPVWIEGPHLFKRGGWYYLSAAEGGTSTRHSQVIFRSRSATGPFEPWAQNPILTQRGLDDSVPGAVNCTGHAQLISDSRGPGHGDGDGHNQWWASFLGCRPGPQGHWATGRETFLLPVRWTDEGWPQIVSPGERVPAQVASPFGTSLADNTNDTKLAWPLNGNYTMNEVFGQAASRSDLLPGWLALRGPHQAWSRIDQEGLHIQPQADTLSSRGRPSFVARRVQHAQFEFSATVQAPEQAGISAGLALFQSETQHLVLALHRHQQTLRLKLTLCNGGRQALQAEQALEAVGSTVSLQLRSDGRQISAGYAASGSNSFITLSAQADARLLSVQAAGGGLHFTGLLAGLLAQQESGHG